MLITVTNTNIHMDAAATFLKKNFPWSKKTVKVKKIEARSQSARLSLVSVLDERASTFLSWGFRGQPLHCLPARPPTTAPACWVSTVNPFTARRRSTETCERSLWDSFCGTCRPESKAGPEKTWKQNCCPSKWPQPTWQNGHCGVPLIYVLN